MATHCDICNTDFIDDYSFHGHLMGKKHLKNVEYANYKEQLQQNSIFLSPIPPQTSQHAITEFFKRFGAIASSKFGHKYVIVEYKNKNPVEFLLKRPIYFNQWRLNIKRRIVDFPQQRKRSPKKSTNKQGMNDSNKDTELMKGLKFKHELKYEPSWQAQLEKFIAYVQDDDDAVQTRCTEVCHSLNLALKQSFPHGNAVRFGSTVTGLHLKNSDIDVFFDIGDPTYDEEEIEKHVSGNRNQQWTPKSIFKEAKSILYKNKSTFSQVVPIPCAKIPVIKFHHIATNIDCDITFKHGLGAHNSQLIKYYLSLDDRLKPLMITIKYWGKSLELCGTGKITNYSLVMATIFYLQQPNVNLLPTVKELQSSCEPMYDSGWLVNFDRTIVRDTSNNKSSIPELLQGFFKFYAEFNFADNVISCWDGLSESRIDFAKKITKFDININAFNLSTAVCIQDPFELDHNIAKRWTERLMRSFQQYCNESLSLCESAAQDEYTSLLPLICDPILKHKSKSLTSIQIPIQAGKFERFGLPDDFETSTNIDNKDKFIEDNWFNVVFKLIEKIFTNVFKFEMSMIYDGIGVKQIKIEEDSDVHTKTRDEILFACRGKYCLNRSRKNQIPSLDPTMSCIEREILISDKILAELKERKDKTTIEFVCTLQKKKNPLHVLVTMSNEEHTNKSFAEIGSYIRSKLQNIIDQELVHMTQYGKSL